ncbi:MAG: formylglycine-generating enzyme family protein [Chloroflexota bacterium]
MNKVIYFLLFIAVVLMLLLAVYFLFVSSATPQDAPGTPAPPTPISQENSPPTLVPTATETNIALIQAPEANTQATSTPMSEQPTVATSTPTPLTLSEMVLIPAGDFIQGSDSGDPKDGPSRIVALPAYEIDKYEVTNQDFALFVATTGYATNAEQSSSGQSWRQYGDGKPTHPVVKVTWNDAVAFCAWAGKRLPTEAEWEKAARGTDGIAYPWGNNFEARFANVKDGGLRRTTSVGDYPEGASSYGVLDMGGNVWEWTDSWFLPYPNNSEPNPYFGEQFRVTRGGGWFEEADQVTTFNRNAADPNITANDDVGFRCARDVTP